MTEPDQPFEVRAIAVERLTFFADAVIAIAITLLALELPVPDGGSNHELLHFANEHRNEYIAFLISFAVIGAYWRGHHVVFRYVTAEGRHLTRLTLVWLLMQVLTPFATRVLTGDGGFQVRFILYAALQAIASMVFIFMVTDTQRHGAVREDTPPTLMSRAKWRSAGIAVAFVISMPISFVSEGAAFGCWIVIPLAVGVFSRARRRRAQLARSQSPASRP